MRRADRVPELQHLGLVRNVAAMRADLRTRWRGLAAQPQRLLHVLVRHVTERDVAAAGRELQRKLATHARTRARDDREPSAEVLHERDLPCIRVAPRTDTTESGIGATPPRASPRGLQFREVGGLGGPSVLVAQILQERGGHDLVLSLVV